MKPSDLHKQYGPSDHGHQSRARAWVQASMMLVIAYAITLDFGLGALACFAILVGIHGLWLAIYQPRSIGMCWLAVVLFVALALDDLQLQHRLDGGTSDLKSVAVPILGVTFLSVWIALVTKLLRSRWVQARLALLRSIRWKASVGVALVLLVGQATLIGPPGYAGSPSFYRWMLDITLPEYLSIRWMLCALGTGWALGLHVPGQRFSAPALLLGLISAALCARSLMPWMDPDPTGMQLEEGLGPVWLVPVAVFGLALVNAGFGRWASDSERRSC